MTVNQEIAERARADRLDVIRDDITRRVRPLCPAMQQDLFIELVETMAAVQLKYELLGPRNG